MRRLLPHPVLSLGLLGIWILLTRLSPGQRIRIGWDPQDARALDPQ